jgi:hypothetical protein
MYAILSTPNFHNQAQALAQKLQLPLHTEKIKDPTFYLYYNDDGLNLIATHLNLGPLHLDFNHGTLHQRLQRAAISKEPLARAVGLHKNLTYIFAMQRRA